MSAIGYFGSYEVSNALGYCKPMIGRWIVDGWSWIFCLEHANTDILVFHLYSLTRWTSRNLNVARQQHVDSPCRHWSRRPQDGGSSRCRANGFLWNHEQRCQPKKAMKNAKYWWFMIFFIVYIYILCSHTYIFIYLHIYIYTLGDMGFPMGLYMSFSWGWFSWRFQTSRPHEPTDFP